MSAANKSWLMVGGLAVVVAAGIFATRQFQEPAAPPAEIRAAAVPSGEEATLAERTQLPTILRAKPVSDTGLSASPRYASQEGSEPQPVSPQFDQGPTRGYPPRAGEPAGTFVAAGGPPSGTTSPPVETPPPGDSQQPGTPAFPQQPGAGWSIKGDADPAATQPRLPVHAGPARHATTYVTRADDSFWYISKRVYDGQGRYFKALYYHNRDRIERPDKIPAGIEIETPPLADLQRRYPDLCGIGPTN